MPFIHLVTSLFEKHGLACALALLGAGYSIINWVTVWKITKHRTIKNLKRYMPVNTRDIINSLEASIELLSKRNSDLSDELYHEQSKLKELEALNSHGAKIISNKGYHRGSVVDSTSRKA